MADSPEDLPVDITTPEIIAACVDLIDDDDREFMQDMEPEDARGYLYTRLSDAGKDPEIELRKVGVLGP